jgi:hypothetical protein
VQAHLEENEVSTGRVLYDAGDTVDYCYFPCGDGREVKSLLVGREGALAVLSAADHFPSIRA